MLAIHPYSTAIHFCNYKPAVFVVVVVGKKSISTLPLVHKRNDGVCCGEQMDFGKGNGEEK